MHPPSPSRFLIAPRLPTLTLFRALLICGVLLLGAAQRSFALGQAQFVRFTPAKGSFVVAESNKTANIYVDSADWPGVVRATNDLQADIARVTALTPAVTHDAARPGTNVIIVGTIGHSPLIDQLIAAGTIDAKAITGQWEAFLTQVVASPMPGVASALIIAGSDKRGTIYGVYNLSEQIGVSPWYWWADVTPDHRAALYVQPGRYVQGSPSVKYRGIFLNDEAPDLTNWIAAKYGMAPQSTNPPVPAGIANYGHEFYGRLFEALLRLRGNYLWPAMWNNAFNEDDPDNARLADEYGVVMGTSHQEPMLRAQKEWDRRYFDTLGSWNYATQPTVLENFWREGVRRNRNFESIITVGLRGANDTEMAPGGPEANRALLETIVTNQRTILSEEINPDVTRVPQAWCLYKEVLDFYNAGMRVPDDITLLWAEDNWGNVRRLPSASERSRSGGAGIYYHFDYHGGPRNYQWINTSPIAKIWDQMSLAKQYGADRIWIVNVGHFKGYELPTEYFLSLAWDTNRWTGSNLGEFTQLWAGREFGPAHAADIADIVSKYTKYNGRRKPELLAPSTYSLVNYQEADTVVADFQAITARAEALQAALPAEKRDAFYELVLFPTKASALVNHLYVAAGKNALYARQGRASTSDLASATRALFQQDLDLMDSFNRTFAGGKWNHFMDQTHLGYLDWRDPDTNSLRAIPLTDDLALPVAAALGVAVEGAETVWPGAAGQPALPSFDVFNQQTRTIDIFNRGQTPFAFTATPNARWLRVSLTQGTVEKDQRISVRIDWSHLPSGPANGTITVTGAGCTVVINATTFKSKAVTRKNLQGFVEGDGFVSIEPEHCTANLNAGASRWTRIEDYGRTLSGMRATGPVDAPAATPGVDSACLEYRIYLFNTGTFDLAAITAPTLNFMAGRPLRYAVSFDHEAPQVVTLVPSDYRAQNGNADWEASVSDNARAGHSSHTITQPGYHTLKLWVIDPGVVLQKLVLNTGNVKPAYLGPPESYRNDRGSSRKP